MAFYRTIMVPALDGLFFSSTFTIINSPVMKSLLQASACVPFRLLGKNTMCF